MLRYFLVVVISCITIGVKSQVTKNTKIADTSSYIIKEVGKNNEFTTISINIKDKDSGVAMLGTIGFRDEKDKLILTVFTDKNGFGYVNLFDASHIARITIDYVGYDRICIPVNQLLKRDWTIEAFLKGESTSD